MIAMVLRFGAIGILATVIHMAGAWASYHGFGLMPYAANLVGFAAAFLASYVGHFFWTFRMSGGHQQALPRFLVVSVGCYLMSNVLVWLIVARLMLSFDVALVAILLMLPVTSFTLNRLWAFRAEEG